MVSKLEKHVSCIMDVHIVDALRRSSMAMEMKNMKRECVLMDQDSKNLELNGQGDHELVDLVGKRKSKSIWTEWQ